MPRPAGAAGGQSAGTGRYRSLTCGKDVIERAALRGPAEPAGKKAAGPGPIGEHGGMLQIVTGMYFRDVPLYETTHRAVLYTNASSLAREAIELPIGRFLFATTMSAVTAVTIEATERLEAVRPDGSDEFMRATGGSELINDAADVFAFALNISCSRNAALIDRLVPPQLDGRPTHMPWSILRRTFDPAVVIRDSDVTDTTEFATKLLTLRRDHFEAAIRSIRSVVDASLLVNDDPGLAYTLFVAALESLAQIAVSVEAKRSWDTYDGTRRKIIDSAVDRAGLNTEQATAVRDAVLEIDQLSLRRRFIDFTLDHVGPTYYRAEAVEAVRPIRANDLPNALDVAYRLRSRNVHVLEALAPELWAITDRADTLRWEGRPALSLEGLNRLCRHVIRAFVDRAPTDIDTTFNYRDHLPGIVRMQVAPQYWIWQADGFSQVRAPQVLEGFIELLLGTMADPEHSHVVDLTAVLEKIEDALPGIAKPDDRRAMVGIYVLWHALLGPDHHRPRAAEFIERFDQDLDDPSVVGFAVRLLTTHPIEWTLDQLTELVEQRRKDLRRGRGQPLPGRVDAALLLTTALELWDAGRVSDAVALVSEAVDAVPGNAELIAIEEAATRCERPAIDLFAFVVGRSEGEIEDEATPPEAAPNAGGEPATPTDET